MSSMLSSRAYTTLNLDIIKSPSSTSWISNSSSPSSTLSESSNSPLTISTRKPRTPRKRPNQIYNEAAAILSTAHPKIFPKNKFTKKTYPSNKNPFFFEPTSELLIPFRVIHNSGFLLNDSLPILERRQPKPTCCLIEQSNSKGFVVEKPCLSPGEITSEICDGYEEDFDFDAESILDDEGIELGSIDSIMGNSTSQSIDNNSSSNYLRINGASSCTYGYPVVVGSHGLRSELRAIRRDVDEGDWWRFPCVNVVDITPKIEKMSMEKKKKKKKIEIKNLVEKAAKSSIDEDSSIPKKNVGLLLKLNYNSVLNEWSDKDSPFSGDAPGGECAGKDVQARLAQIDLFSEDNGMRGASVLRYKEKRHTRLFSKKIRYQVRKVNADRRPRMKGRFVRSPNSTDNEQGL